MVEAVIFIGVIVVVVGGTLSGALWLTRARPGQTRLVLLGAAAGREEAQVWLEAFRRAGIRAHIQSVGESAWVPTSYAHEFWVRPKDEARAREVLGP